MCGSASLSNPGTSLPRTSALKAIKLERNIEAIMITLIETATKRCDGNDDAQLRATVCDLITSGDQPNERARVHQVGYGLPETTFLSDVCLDCGDPRLTVTYPRGRRAANLHATCDTLWK